MKKSLDRRTELIYLFQSKKRFTVNDLAERFEVSRRTIFRDIRALQENNVPITWDPDEGYALMRGANIPPLMFTGRELATIILGISFLKSQTIGTMVEDAKATELKIENALPKELRDFFIGLDTRAVTNPYHANLTTKDPGGDWFLICDAISSGKTIQFNYRDKKTETISPRKVNPFVIVYFTDHWNLIGHAHDRNATRNFILNRMSDIEILTSEPTFEHPPARQLQDLIFHMKHDSPDVEVRVDQDALRKFKLSLPSPIVRETSRDDGTHITFRFDNLDFINEWLLQFAGKVTILKPKELIEKRRVLLRSLLDG